MRRLYYSQLLQKEKLAYIQKAINIKCARKKISSDHRLLKPFAIHTTTRRINGYVLSICNVLKIVLISLRINILVIGFDLWPRNQKKNL